MNACKLINSARRVKEERSGRTGNLAERLKIRRMSQIGERGRLRVSQHKGVVEMEDTERIGILHGLV